MLGYANWYAQKSYREFLFFVPFQQVLLLGPVFYFYVRALVSGNLKFNNQDLIHFLPAILYLTYSLIVFITDKFILNEFYFYDDGQDKDLDFWYQISGLISMLFYLLLSLMHYGRYRKLTLQEVSFADEIAYKWVKYFIIAFCLILLLRVLFFILNPEWGEFGNKYWYYFCFSSLILYISISGYSNSIKITERRNALSFQAIEVTSKDPIAEDTNNTADTLNLEEWKQKITRLFFEEETYKNPNLTLTDLASLLNTNRNIISRVINQAYRMNFNDFVNEKRAKAVIEKLKEGEHAKNTLLGIAMDCGFNSKTTFNRVFKKHTGSTPRQFIAKNQD